MDQPRHPRRPETTPAPGREVTRAAARAAARILTVIATLGVALAGGATIARAQSVAQNVGHDVVAAGSDIWWVWTSPFHAKPRDWRDAGVVLATSALISTADERIDRWIVKNQTTGVVKALRPRDDKHGLQLVDLATANVLLPLSGGLYVAGLASGSRGLRDAGMGCAASQQSDAIFRGLVYSIVQRDRPSIANGDAFRFRVPGGSWNHHSFFGGHVANAMACATFANNRFRLGAPGKLLYVAAGAIGFARMADRQHWASDTFLGASFGYAVGRTVANRQRKRLAREQSAAHSRDALLEPPHDDGSVAERAIAGLYAGTSVGGRPMLGWRASF